MSYYTVHDRLRRVYGPARNHQCVDCGKTAADWSYDHSCPDERYALLGGRLFPYSCDLARYQPRCKPCHATLDGDFTPCLVPDCNSGVRRPYTYCWKHPVVEPRRLPQPGYREGGGREFGCRVPTDANGRAYAARTTVKAAFTHKVCGRCKVRKPVASFSTRGAEAANRPDPFKSRCLECDRERANARYAKRKAQCVG